MLKAVYRLVLVAVSATTSLPALNYSFTGNFAAATDVAYFHFTTAGGTVTSLETLSYGGGTNSLAASIPAGGFDPLITIFDQAGIQVGSFDNSAAPVSGCLGTITAGTNGCLDSYFNNSLGAGTYTVALTQFNNLPQGNLPDGFLISPGSECTNPTVFCDGFDATTARSNAWALELVTVTNAGPGPAVVGAPEPGTLGLALGGAILLALRRRRSTAVRR